MKFPLNQFQGFPREFAHGVHNTYTIKSNSESTAKHSGNEQLIVYIPTLDSVFLYMCSLIRGLCVCFGLGHGRLVRANATLTMRVMTSAGAFKLVHTKANASMMMSPSAYATAGSGSSDLLHNREIVWKCLQ